MSIGNNYIKNMKAKCIKTYERMEEKTINDKLTDVNVQYFIEGKLYDMINPYISPLFKEMSSTVDLYLVNEFGNVHCMGCVKSKTENISKEQWLKDELFSKYFTIVEV